jgi:hypothetical protein
MARFLIEAPHDAETAACARVVKAFLTSGSHFVTHADWGCMDGDHRAWIIVDVENKDEARGIIPPTIRASSKIIALNYFALDHIEEILKQHESPSS